MRTTIASQEPKEPRLLITCAEAAAALGVSPRYLRTLTYQGVLPSVKLGRLRRIAMEDLRGYVDGLRGLGEATTRHLDLTPVATGREPARRGRARGTGPVGACTGVPAQRPEQGREPGPEHRPEQGPGRRSEQSLSAEPDLSHEDRA
jgi:excisionase family DNA binding protein